MTRRHATLARAGVRLVTATLAAVTFTLAGMLAGASVGALLALALYPSSLLETVIAMTAITGAILGALAGIALVVRDTVEVESW